MQSYLLSLDSPLFRISGGVRFKPVLPEEAAQQCGVPLGWSRAGGPGGAPCNMAPQKPSVRVHTSAPPS